MIVRGLAVSATLLVTACNQAGPANDTAAVNTTTPAMPTNTAAPVAMAADSTAKFDQYARCATTMLTMSRLYSVLASSESGAKRDNLLDQSQKRKKVAAVFYQAAVDNGATIGKTKDDIESIRADVDSRYDRMRETEGFEKFAGAVAGDADACQEVARTAT